MFSGGCTLEAIEEVCSGDPVEPEEVMDLVTGLVARSLVVAEDSAPGTRFRMLETIRQYGEERLADWGETDGLYASACALLCGPIGAGRRALLRARPDRLGQGGSTLERDNIRAALATAIDAANAALAVRLVANHPHHHGYGGTGEVFDIDVPASRVLDLPNARDEAGYPRVVMAAAWHAYLTWRLREQQMNSDAKRSKLIRIIRQRSVGPGSSWTRAT